MTKDTAPIQTNAETKLDPINLFLTLSNSFSPELQEIDRETGLPGGVVMRKEVKNNIISNPGLFSELNNLSIRTLEDNRNTWLRAVSQREQDVQSSNGGEQASTINVTWQPEINRIEEERLRCVQIQTWLQAITE